tara:strand:+ start:407 stop:559 length:153 start_codon:yes stop_codon:yes gene_type:complete
MVKRTWETTDKKGHLSEWSWEETPEVVAAVKELARLKAQDDAFRYDTSSK